jgi:hypothetical protein
MAYPTGHLQQHPLPQGVTGALSLSGYQLLADVAGVGAGRLGQQVFLVAAPEPDTVQPGQDPGTQLVLHQSKLRNEEDAQTFIALAGQLGYLRLSGYRLLLERNGLRSRMNVLDPATGAVALAIPDKHPGAFFAGGARSAPGMLAIARALPAAGPAPDLSSAEALQQSLLMLALSDDALDPGEAVEMADQALALIKLNPDLDPAGALAAAKQRPAT